MRQFTELVMLSTLVTVATILLVSAQVHARAHLEIEYYPRGQDPGHGNRLVGCCERWDMFDRRKYSEFGYCHLLLKETEGCRECCKDMKKRSKARYRSYQTDCECV